MLFLPIYIYTRKILTDFTCEYLRPPELTTPRFVVEGTQAAQLEPTNGKHHPLKLGYPRWKVDVDPQAILIGRLNIYTVLYIYLIVYM